MRAIEALGPKKMLAVGASAIPVALPCSFVPIAIACWAHTGSWSGNPSNRLAIEVTHPVAGVLGNGVDFVQGLLYPPLIPGVGAIDRLVESQAGRTSVYSWIQSHYPGYDVLFHHELPTEEAAGIGLGLAILLLLWLAKSFRGGSRTNPLACWHARLFALATCVATAAYLAKAGGDNAPRLMLPYTPLLILSVLAVTRSPRVCPSPHWCWLPVLFLLPALVLNPNRPLLPASFVSNLPLVPEQINQRMQAVYSAYSRRNDLLADLREAIPAGEAVEFGGPGDSPSYSLFRPFGSRSVYELGRVPNPNAKWVVGTQEGIEMRTGMPVDEWESLGHLRHHEAMIVDKISKGPDRWCVWRRTQ
jgi:hypothetical protein